LCDHFMKTNYLFIGIIACCFSFGCETDTSFVGAKATIGGQSEKVIGSSSTNKQKFETNVKSINGVSFKADLMSADEFLKRRGEVVSENEAVKLSKESVLLFEVTLESGAAILDAQSLQISQNELPSYMMAQLKNDLIIVQNNKSYSATDVLFDGNSVSRNKIRAFLFFNQLSIDKKIQTKYNDRLFGSGTIIL